jgi:DNA-binding NarL/FixJ family response regulator
MTMTTPSFGQHAGEPRSEHDAHDATTPLTVALVNDYEIIVRGLHAMLEPFSDRVAIVEHEIGGTPHRQADIALFDTFAGRRDAIHRAEMMAREGHVEHIVLYTWDATDSFLDQARAAGVSAVIMKSTAGAELVHALERVAEGDEVELSQNNGTTSTVGREPLSMREREVLAMLALGYRNAEIAQELFLSVDTVKTYVRRLFQKLGVNNRTQAALRAGDYGLAPPQTRVERLTAGRSDG